MMTQSTVKRLLRSISHEQLRTQKTLDKCEKVMVQMKEIRRNINKTQLKADRFLDYKYINMTDSKYLKMQEAKQEQNKQIKSTQQQQLQENKQSSKQIQKAVYFLPQAPNLMLLQQKRQNQKQTKSLAMKPKISIQQQNEQNLKIDVDNNNKNNNDDKENDQYYNNISNIREQQTLKKTAQEKQKKILGNIQFSKKYQNKTEKKEILLQRPQTGVQRNHQNNTMASYRKQRKSFDFRAYPKYNSELFINYENRLLK